MADPIPFRGETKAADTGQRTERTPHTDERVYSNEEVTEIIRVALERSEHVDRDTVTRDELVWIGRDFGLTEGDLDNAYDRIARKRVVSEGAEKAMLSFKIHVICFGVVMTGLFLINMLSDPSEWWVLYPLVSWGTVVVLHGVLAKYVPSMVSWIAESNFGSMQLNAQCHLETQNGLPVAAFKIGELYHGLAETKGMARVDEEGLILEHQTVDTALGYFKSRVHETVIPFSEIASARLERKLWHNKLILRSHRMAALQHVPGESGGEVRLTFSGAARPASERLARQLMAGIGK